VFDLLQAKLHPPRVRSGSIGRPSLVTRLVESEHVPVVSVVAPAGFGKTTLLAQWTAPDARPTVWVSVDETDNDARVLLSYVAAGLGEVEPIDPGVFEALASPGSSVPGSVVPRLASALWSMSVPVLLLLDDVHLLHNRETKAALSVLAEHVPPSSQLVLAGRSDPPLRVARLRAEGRIVEIGTQELSMSPSEASALLENAEVNLAADDVVVLHRRTEGWPAGLYLAALCLRQGGSVGQAADSIGGDHRLISEYMESEFLGRITSQQRKFLLRTSILTRLSGPLCDAVLGLPAAHVMLSDLARSNMLLVGLDHHQEWFRYHHLFRDMLLAELQGAESDLVPELNRRAAEWHRANGMLEEALEYSMAAGDVDAAARLIEQLWLTTYQQARVTTVQRWLHWLEAHASVERYPMAAIAMSFVAAMIGRTPEADRWADVVERWQGGTGPGPDDAPADAWASMLKAILCRHGIEQMTADADEAAERFAALNMTELAPALYQGLAKIYTGDPDAAEPFFTRASRDRHAITTAETVAVALAERSLLAIARGDWVLAGTLSDEAGTVLREAGFEGTLVSAVQARIALHRGDLPATRRHLVVAQRTRVVLTDAIPHVAVQARTELIRVHLALADPAAARTLMREIDQILLHRPDLGTLVRQAADLRTELADHRRGGAPQPSALTSAELRLLPMLCTHLSFPEIAAGLFVSPHTIKSQARSIYRKLGASSRNQAVERARELGLLDA
jgi:LuxR family maltose regulon positive regulatory protein